VIDGQVDIYADVSRYGARVYQLAGGRAFRSGEADEDAAVTFGRVKRLAFAVHKHRRADAEIGLTDPNRKRPPRLTETWFC